jgi:hypothetical protein
MTLRTRNCQGQSLLPRCRLGGLLLLTLWAGCQSDRPDGSDDANKPPIGSPCSQDSDCHAGRRCIAQRCQVDHGDCTSDNDCEDDTYCACPPELSSERCACVPWGSPPRLQPNDPSCAGAVFQPEDFKNPILKCSWPPAGTPPAYKDSLSSPVVIDLDGDGAPEIVFAAGYTSPGHLIALSGKDCSVKWDRAANVSGCMHIAAADLDGDGKIEIVAHSNGLAIFDYQGNLLAQNSEPGGALCVRDYPPAIANLDGVGSPEIVAGAAVFRFVRSPTPQLVRLWNKNLLEEGSWATIAIAQDLDGDGKMEVVSGHNVFDGISGADKTPSVMKSLGGGYPAIADFNRDGLPDIVLVSSRMGDQQVSVIDYAHNRLLMPPTAAKDGWGGPPTVADFDGDGQPEFATASSNFYYVYSPDCLTSPLPAKCVGSEDGVLWQSATQDDSSGSTGSSVFDFNGDGIAEVVYRDECWLRVYSGVDGRKLFVAPVTSGTIVELPIIADTDGDGHSEIVVTADSAQNDKCRSGRFPRELGIDHPGISYGLRVYVDPQNRWMPSRPLWNQHSYHITNINDDGTIPASEAPNWKSYNSYRQNVQGMGSSKPAQPDATTRIELPPDVGDCVRLFRLGGELCNRGAAPMGAGYPATFYLGDPRRPGAQLLCTAYSAKATLPGQCQPISCDWSSPPAGPYDLWLRGDDDGKPGQREPQCKAGNDLAHLGLTSCLAGPA